METEVSKIFKEKVVEIINNSSKYDWREIKNSSSAITLSYKNIILKVYERTPSVYNEKDNYFFNVGIYENKEKSLWSKNSNSTEYIDSFMTNEDKIEDAFKYIREQEYKKHDTERDNNIIAIMQNL